MMENGKMAKLRDLEYLRILILMFIMVSFKETELMGMECTFIKMDRNMKVIGKMMSKKDKERKF